MSNFRVATVNWRLFNYNYLITIRISSVSMILRSNKRISMTCQNDMSAWHSRYRIARKVTVKSEVLIIMFFFFLNKHFGKLLKWRRMSVKVAKSLTSPPAAKEVDSLQVSLPQMLDLALGTPEVRRIYLRSFTQIENNNPWNTSFYVRV